MKVIEKKRKHGGNLHGYNFESHVKSSIRICTARVRQHITHALLDHTKPPLRKSTRDQYVRTMGY